MKKCHLGIILDGNRRWAKENGLPSYQGHKKGLETALKVIERACERGVGMLTLFVFSTENWKRSRIEVNLLMSLIEEFFNKEFKENQKNDLFRKIKVRIVGQREKISKKINEIVSRIEKMTEKNTGMVLNIALSYGGRSEIVEVVKKVIENSVPEKDINEEYIKKNLSIPDIDFIIRTGKEKRLSNFFIWQSAYAELYFPDKYWPEFTENDLDEALEYYRSRQRRFGK